MDFSKVTAIEIPEGKVTKIEDSQGNVLWNSYPDPAKYAYGIRWNHNVPDSQATTACERIGNLELHKTLPIQSKFATCIHQGTNIQYWCHPNDSRFRKDNTGYVFSNLDIECLVGNVVKPQPTDYSSNDKFDAVILFNNIEFNELPDEIKIAITTYKYLYAYIKVDGVVCRVNKVTFNGTFLVTVISGTLTETTNATVEFGCSINGYDGEIGVYIPRFYLWSVDNDGTDNEVWQSEKKCVPYAREVKPHIIGISRCALLRQAMNDDKWGWLNTLSENTALSVCNYRPELRGGYNNSSFDQYLGKSNFRTMLGKGALGITLDVMRTASQKIENCQLLYYQIWSAIVWCYFIEYANFNIKENFNSNLTDEGYHQGGLGLGVCYVSNIYEYNSASQVVPIDYTLSIGNNTNIVTNPLHSFTKESLDNTDWRIWDRNRVTGTLDSTNNKILNITAIPKIYNDWMLSSAPKNVGGTHRYKIEGLTDGQTVVFVREQGNLTITTDGEYDVDWGSNYSNRYIIFGKAQETCDIKVTILSSPAFTYTLTQKQLDVPCYRGFNVFWYGDTWLEVENFISQYDSTSNKRKFYFTDNPNNFSNDISNKENIISIDVQDNNWIKNIMAGKTANLIPNESSNNLNYTNCHKLDNVNTLLHCTLAGGSAALGMQSGLISIQYNMDINNTRGTFVKCCILE